MKNERLISVIVPVYKVENYLNQCLESIVKQTYSNLEILLVDDGSPDRCPEICDEWARKEKRVRAIHKQNGGLSDARNAGLALAQGELVMFVDSDDWIAPEMAEKMLEAMEREEADMVICQYIKVLPDGKTKRVFNGTEAEKIYNQKEMYRLLLEDREISNHVWRRLYKKSLLPASPFPVNKNYEDLYTMAGISSRCKRFVSLNEAYYFYRENPDGIVKSANFKNMNDYLDALEKNIADINRFCPELTNEIQQSKMRTTIYAWQSAMLSRSMSPEEKEIIRKRIEKWADVPPKQAATLRFDWRIYYVFVYKKKDRAAAVWYHLWFDAHGILFNLKRMVKYCIRKQ